MLFGVLAVVSWVMLLMGNMAIDIELDSGFQLNAYVLIALLTALLTFTVYGISFMVIYGSLFLFSSIKTR